ncbi:hypothetical protein Pmani_012267 [Petrolisthes manimaculis]|nr:hypothetical protein Pmani_012267 [Petrolisthes manimaculis]
MRAATLSHLTHLFVNRQWHGTLLKLPRVCLLHYYPDLTPQLYDSLTQHLQALNIKCLQNRQHQWASPVCQLPLLLDTHLQTHHNSGRTLTYARTTRGSAMLYAFATPRLPYCQTNSGKQIRRWQDNALHANAHSMTSNLGPPSNTPTHQQHHLHAPSTTNYNTATNFANAPLPPAQQHVSKPGHTHHYTSRTLLWV